MGERAPVKLGNKTECTNTANRSVMLTEMGGGKGSVSKGHIAPKVGKRAHCTAQDWSPKPQNSNNHWKWSLVYL